MEANRVGTGQSNLPSQVGGAQNKSGEEAFHSSMGGGDGYDKESMDKAVSERTRLTRTGRTNKSKNKNASLFVISDDEDLHKEPVYRTVMVDGIPFTLRLLAVA